MNHKMVAAAAFSFFALASSAALAHGHVHGGLRFYPAPYYPYSFYPWYPYAAYPAHPVYPPPPIVIGRYRIAQAPQPPQYRYEEREERTQAQVTPPPPRRMERITLSAQELFAFDEARLRPSQPRLDEIADLMVRNPQIDRVTITGHTDRIGTASYNLELSQRRAEAVKRYLVGKGVDGKRLAAVGKGKADPVVQCNDKKMADLIKCLAPNRRVEVEQITIERRAR